MNFIDPGIDLFIKCITTNHFFELCYYLLLLFWLYILHLRLGLCEMGLLSLTTYSTRSRQVARTRLHIIVASLTQYLQNTVWKNCYNSLFWALLLPFAALLAVHFASLARTVWKGLLSLTTSSTRSLQVARKGLHIMAAFLTQYLQRSWPYPGRCNTLPE